MKIHNALSFLELQGFLRDNSINMHIDFVASANAWRVRIGKNGTAIERSGLGRTIGEAMANAYERYTEDVK